MKNKIKCFQIGDFCFRVSYPESMAPPANFLLFETHEEMHVEYRYQIEVRQEFSPDDLAGCSLHQPAAVREELILFSSRNLETRLLKPTGKEEYYALYRELSDTEALIFVYESFWDISYLDTAFCSLFALERRLLRKHGLILHCACLRYGEAAILFSGASGVGKSTQASLWETYKNAAIMNGDRILLQYRDTRWNAYGWPVCGSSGICENMTLPVRAIVMLSQEKENMLSLSGRMEAFASLYRQVTVNGWNPSSAGHVMDLIEALIREIPVYHLGCTVSKEAVELLAEELDRSMCKKGERIS